MEVDAIREICDRHKLLFIEDAAHSLGSKFNGRNVGSLADMTEFSFHPVKTCTAGEGGAVTTDDDELYKRLLLFRTHGITRESDLMEKESEGGWYYQQIMLGYNYRMTDIQAALLSSQLDKLNLFSKRRGHGEQQRKVSNYEINRIIGARSGRRGGIVFYVRGK